MIFGMCVWKTDQSNRSELQQEEAGINVRSLLPWKHYSLETQGEAPQEELQSLENQAGS